MTEKRLIVDENYNLVDTVTGEWLDDTQVFDLANELHEENEQLKHDATVLICSNQEYRKENKQLKQKIKSIKEILIKDIGYVESFKKIVEILND